MVVLWFSYGFPMVFGPTNLLILLPFSHGISPASCRRNRQAPAGRRDDRCRRESPASVGRKNQRKTTTATSPAGTFSSWGKKNMGNCQKKYQLDLGMYIYIYIYNGIWGNGMGKFRCKEASGEINAI